MHRQPDAEFDFLCLIVRPRPDWTAARAVLREGLDHDELLRLAAQHAVRPQLVEAYGRFSWEGVPAPVRAECDDFRHFHLARMLFLSDTLRRVDELFARHGIALATFKGAALAAALYGDLSRREYGDLDIIVPPEQVSAAERLLGSLGYSGPERDSEFRRTFLAYQRQYAFVNDTVRASIDLHWHFNGVHSPFPLQPSEIWQDLVPVQIGDRAVPTLHGANLALLLAGHGTKEAWKKLGWVRDFAMLSERQLDLDWSSIHARARAQGCGNAVLLGCALSYALFGTAIPPAIGPQLTGNRRVRSMVASIVATLRSGRPFAPVRPYLEDLDLCDHWRDKLGSVVRQGLTRTVGDYESWPLPPALWSVYYATRPFRLFAKAAAKATGIGQAR